MRLLKAHASTVVRLLAVSVYVEIYFIPEAASSKLFSLNDK